MKRFGCAVLTLCMMLCLLTAFAAGAECTYLLEDLGTITLDDSLDIFSHTMAEDDPVLQKYGVPKENIVAAMEEQSACLYAKHPQGEYDITVTTEDFNAGNLDKYSNEELEELIIEIIRSYDAAGIRFLRSEQYTNSQAKFIKIYTSSPGTPQERYGLQYFTVYNGKSIVVTMQTLNGQMDEEREAVMKQIVDSIALLEDRYAEGPCSYTETVSGMTIYVPVGWKAYEPEVVGDMVTMIFETVAKPSKLLELAVKDLLGEESKELMTEREYTSMTREDIGNDIFNTEEVAEMLSCEETQLSKVTYNDREYYLAKTEYSQEVEGNVVSADVTHLMRIENGYMYQFYFMGTTDDPRFSDVERMLSTAEYPFDTPEFPYGSNTPVVSNKDIQRGAISSFLIGILAYAGIPMIFAAARDAKISRKRYRIICFCGNLAVYLIYGFAEGFLMVILPYVLWTGVFVACGRKLLTKRGVLEEGEEAEEQETPAAMPAEEIPAEQATQPAAFCPNCGAEAVEGTKFCRKCGNELQ